MERVKIWGLFQTKPKGFQRGRRGEGERIGKKGEKLSREAPGGSQRMRRV